MKKWQILLLTILVGLQFLGYAIIRPDIIGSDSYFYMSHLCGKIDNNAQGKLGWNDGIEKALFGWMPCSFLWAKAVLFACCLLSVLLIAKMGELFDKENGWKAGSAAILLTPFLFLEFFKFENCQIAWPILFFGLYLWMAKKRLPALIITCFAGLIWHGAILYMIAYSFSASWTAIIFTSIIFGFVSIQQLAAFLPNFSVVENWPIIGFTSMMLLLPAFSKIPKEIFWETAIIAFVALLNAKYAILLIPFLAIGAMHWFNQLKPNFQSMVVAFGIGFYIIIPFFILTAHPTQLDHSAIKTALDLNKNIQNDWDLGYWIIWDGGNPSAIAGGDYNNFDLHGIILTQFKQPCPIVKDFNRLAIYNCGTN